MQPRCVLNELVHALMISAKSWKRGLKEKKIDFVVHEAPFSCIFFFQLCIFLKNVMVRVLSWMHVGADGTATQTADRVSPPRRNMI